MVVDEDTEGEFIAREKEEPKNRILEGVTKNKGNQLSKPRKISEIFGQASVQPWQKRKFFRAKARSAV